MPCAGERLPLYAGTFVCLSKPLSQLPGARALRWRAAAAACSRAASSAWNAADEGSSSGLWQALSRRSMRRTWEHASAHD